MQHLKKIAALIAAIMIGSSTVAGAQEFEVFPRIQKSPYNDSLLIQNPNSPPWRMRSLFEFILDLKNFALQNKLCDDEEIEPKYGLTLTKIREKYSERPFVKEVLTDEVAEFLNEKEVETGIPGAVIIAQAIWEVGWDLSTPKTKTKNSYNLFNIKNCDGNYVYWDGCKYQCYDSYIDSMEAYIELITTLPRYQKAYEYLKNDGDFSTYYRMLGDAGYYEASKISYSEGCASIIKSNELIEKQPIA